MATEPDKLVQVTRYFGGALNHVQRPCYVDQRAGPLRAPATFEVEPFWSHGVLPASRSRGSCAGRRLVDAGMSVQY